MNPVCIVGAGYVGLVTAAGLAETGNPVVCAERDPSRVTSLEKGEPWFYEPGLNDLLTRNLANGRLRVTTDTAEAVANAAITFVCVGTPMSATGHADLTAVRAVLAVVALHARPDAVVVLKSTVPVGTHAEARAQLDAAGRPDVHVASNPEFLREGRAVQDFLRPHRIVIGLQDSVPTAVRDALAALYQPLTFDQPRIAWTDPASAELSKYTTNAMLAVRISLMNEIARVCDATGADIHAVRRIVAADPRIGPQYLYAGPGYGGSCLPKDVRALAESGGSHGLPMTLLRAADQVNDDQAGVLFDKVASSVGGDVAGQRIALWGLAFKPHTDDVRRSPALTLARRLADAGATVVAHDPHAIATTRDVLGDAIAYAQDEYVAAKGAHAVVLMTEWPQYQNADFHRLLDLLSHPVVVDSRNIWSGSHLPSLGFTYVSMGARAQ